MEFITKIAEKFLDKDKPSGNQEGYSNQGGYGGGDQGGYGGQQPGGYGGGYPQQQQHSGPQVPPPWVARWDGESQRWYYVNEQTGERTWNHPGQGDGYGQPQPSYGGGAPYGGEQSYGQQPSYGYGESRQGDYNQQQQEPKKDHSGAKIAGAAVLGLAGGALGGYAVHEAYESVEDHKEEWKQDIQDFPEDAAEWTGEKVGEVEAGWDRTEDRVEQGWDNAVENVENFPENAAEWTGEKVGAVEQFGDDMHDAYERGEDEGRGDNDW